MSVPTEAPPKAGATIFVPVTGSLEPDGPVWPPPQKGSSRFRDELRNGSERPSGTNKTYSTRDAGEGASGNSWPFRGSSIQIQGPPGVRKPLPGGMDFTARIFYFRRIFGKRGMTRVGKTIIKKNQGVGRISPGGARLITVIIMRVRIPFPPARNRLPNRGGKWARNPPSEAESASRNGMKFPVSGNP